MALKILVVDDDAVDRMAVQRALRSGGIEAVLLEASECAEALELLRKERVDLVMLDYVLPDGNGLDLLRALREAGVACPAVVLTGQGDEAIAVELMKAGASDYLPKSLATSERIAQCVRSALRVHAAESLAAQAERARKSALVQERAAREEADVAHRRLAFLAEASGLLAASLDPAANMEAVARLAVPFLADWCFIDLAEDPPGAFSRAAVAHARPEDAEVAARMRRRFAPILDAPHGISRVIVSGRSEILLRVPDWVLVSLARDGEHLEALRRLGVRSAIVVPLTARGKTLGAMTFLGCSPERAYGMSDLAFAEELARRVAQGLDNARLYQQAVEAEERLRRQLDFTTAIARGLSESVLALDAEGRVSFANPAAEALLGRSAPELVRARAEEVLAPAPGAVHESAALLAAIREGRPLRLDQARFVRPDGAPIVVGLSVGPLLEGGRPRGAVLAFHDVQDRLRAQAELEASRRQLAQSEKLSALGTLVSGVAHELRTPLTYLSNNIFLLQRRLETVAREQPALRPLLADASRHGHLALEGVERINALVKELRPFVKGDGARRMQPGLEGVVAEAVELFRATTRGHVHVEADLAPTGPVLAEKGQIQRAVINLLLNGAEAMPRGGTLRVWTRATEEGAELGVRDEGTGIPEDVQTRVFDPFFTTKADGTGLGLAITRRIVDAHGGAIRFVTSPEGTTFTLQIPRARPVPIATEPAPAPGGLQPPAVGDGG